MSSYDDGLPDEWSAMEAELFIELTRFDEGSRGDLYLQELYHEALYDPDLSPDDRHAIREALESYWYDEYDGNFGDDFDWHAWAEWYDSQ